jgi:hypothetical protein
MNIILDENLTFGFLEIKYRDFFLPSGYDILRIGADPHNTLYDLTIAKDREASFNDYDYGTFLFDKPTVREITDPIEGQYYIYLQSAGYGGELRLRVVAISLSEDSLDKGIIEVVKDVNKDMTGIIEAIDSGVNRILYQQSQTFAGMYSGLTSKITDVANTVNNGISGLNNAISSEINDVAGTIANELSMSSITSHMDISNLTSTVENSIGNGLANIDNAITLVNAKAVEGINKLGDTINDSIYNGIGTYLADMLQAIQIQPFNQWAVIRDFFFTKTKPE